MDRYRVRSHYRDVPSALGHTSECVFCLLLQEIYQPSYECTVLTEVRRDVCISCVNLVMLLTYCQQLTSENSVQFRFVNSGILAIIGNEMLLIDVGSVAHVQW